ncbi:MAG: hypothetical protein LAN62_11455 [Acidobacteriia bacterium]|nr:hypothetical protein [Terriglobia bacterium]
MPHERLRRVFPFHLALASIIALWVYIGVGSDVADPDIWWHLRNAEYLFTHLDIPRVDLYSFTALGQPWINHEWLAEVPYYLAWRAGGLMGIYVLCLALCELNLLGIFHFACKAGGNPKSAFLVTCFGILLTKVSYGPRTILFGYLFLLFLLLLLWRYRSTRRGPLWVLPPLFCLWVNTHGSWLLGLIVFGVFVASGLVERNWGRVEAARWTPGQLRSLLATGAASIALLFVNPYGYRLVYYPFDLAFRQKLNVASIEEWASVDFNDPRGKVIMFLLAWIFLSSLFSRARWKLEDVALAAFGLYSGLTHVRFLFLAAILLAPFLTKTLAALPPYRREVDKPLLNALIFGIVLMIAARRFPSRADLDQSVARRFPVAALSFVKSHGLPGRVLNAYFWGGFLIWHCPEVKTLVDSRTDIFEYSGVLKDYLDVERVKDALEVLDKYRIRYVMVALDSRIAYFLKNNIGWKVIFSDQVCTIFERAPAPPDAASQGRELR